MKTYHYVETQVLNSTPEPIWAFFATPKNLPVITPPDLGFRGNFSDESMYNGQVFRYQLRMMGFPMTWISRISEVIPMVMFVDEQIKGPYAYWRHQHHFKEQNGKVEMTDSIAYALPLGVLGRLAHRTFVQREIKRIFAYRRAKLEALFNSTKSA